MNFIEWFKKQETRPDSIGFLSKEIMKNSSFTPKTSSAMLRVAIAERWGSNGRMMKVFNEACQEYFKLSPI